MADYWVTDIPHIRKDCSVPKIFWAKAAGLFVISLLSFAVFGLTALALFFAAVSAALAAEYAACRLSAKEPRIQDGSSVYFGILFFLLLPPATPLGAAFAGCFLAVFLGKEIFGGTGQSIFHPVLAGWLSSALFLPDLFLAGPGETFFTSFFVFLKNLGEENFKGLFHFFFRPAASFFGEISLAGVFLFGLCMLKFRVNRFSVPLIFLGTLWGVGLWTGAGPAAGDLPMSVLVAFCLVDEPAVSPVTSKGRFVYAVCCALSLLGLLLVWDFIFAAAFSVLLWNALSAWLDEIFNPAREIKTEFKK